MSESSTIHKNPVFILGPEKGTDTDGIHSIDEPLSSRGVTPTAGTMLEYPAEVDQLRIISPYKVELNSRLGHSVYVLQFTEYSLDSVPNDWKRREPPLLWKVSIDGPNPIVGFVTDQDLKTFYFPEKVMARSFLSSILGEGEGPSFQDVLDQRDRLTRLLG